MDPDQTVFVRIDGELTMLHRNHRLHARRLTAVEPVSAQRRGRSNAGHYWSSTMERHVAFGVAAEKHLLQWLDWRDDVVRIIHRPVGTEPSSADLPAYLVVHSNETVAFITDRTDAPFHRWSAALEKLTGWPTHTPPPMPPAFWANLKFLSQFRRPSTEREGLSEIVKKQFERPHSLAAVDDFPDRTAERRGVLFQLMWDHELSTDMNRRIGDSSIVWDPSAVVV